MLFCRNLRSILDFMVEPKVLSVIFFHKIKIVVNNGKVITIIFRLNPHN